jgi:hypothetical protein
LHVEDRSEKEQKMNTVIVEKEVIKEVEVIK